MPKNQFQRPLPVKHSHNVPRHGKPHPLRKVEAKRAEGPKEIAPIPVLQDLLNRPAHS